MSDSTDEHSYFRTNQPPPDLASASAQAANFITRHATANRPLVLVTSGGTSVPLETNMVRFIDNFSAGTRGAASAEVFLDRGYAVLFLHREYSLLPYSRHFPAASGVLEYLVSNDAMVYGQQQQLTVKREHSRGIKIMLDKYTHATTKEKSLLMLSFTTVNDYLWKLKTIATLMRALESKALFYLAAAVSDFFIPPDRMVEHKIQSSEAFAHHGADVGGSDSASPAARIDAGKLIIDLDPVPKFFKQLVDGWAPQGMIVSFKLETDPGLLVQKARYALERYSHHLVIGNLLSTRKWEVVLVSATKGEEWIRLPESQRGAAAAETSPGGSEDSGRIEIESLIVPQVQELHEQHMASVSSRA